MLDLKQPKYGWFGISFRSKSHRPQLIVRALDGKPVRDQRIPGGLVLTPGPHLVTLSARYQSKADIASRFGEAAEKLGQKLDSMPSKHDRPVPVNAVAGEDYVAHMKPKGDSFRYWIEED